MKIAALIARLLLGLVFFVFGINGIFPFIPAPPLPGGLAGQFLTALFQSHYVLFVSVCQIAGGLLLLVNLYVPLALTLLGPVIVNILLFHLLLFRTGMSMAIIVALLWVVLALRHRQYFSGLFVRHAP